MLILIDTVSHLVPTFSPPSRPAPPATHTFIALLFFEFGALSYFVAECNLFYL